MTEIKVARKQAERREEAERRLISAAIRLLVEKGYDGFSLAELADLAGYSRGLPAHYFGKKEELLAQAVDVIVSRYHDSLAEIDSLEPGFDRLEKKIRSYVAGYGSRQGKALTTLIAEGRLRSGLRRTIIALNGRTRERWQNEVRACMQAEGIGGDADPIALGAMIHAILRGQSSFVDLDPGYDVGTTIETLIELLREKLSSAKA